MDQRYPAIGCPAAQVSSTIRKPTIWGLTNMTLAYAPGPPLAGGFDTIDFPFGSNNAAVIDSVTGDGFPTVSRLNEGDTISGGSTFSGPK